MRRVFSRVNIKKKNAVHVKTVTTYISRFNIMQAMLQTNRSLAVGPGRVFSRVNIKKESAVYVKIVAVDKEWPFQRHCSGYFK